MGKWLRVKDNPKPKRSGCSVASRTAGLKWRWRRWVKKIPCSHCFFLPSSFQEWSGFGSHMKKETFALDQFRQQAGDKHSLKENNKQRKKPKHPKRVTTWGMPPFVRCHPGSVKGGRWWLQPARGQVAFPPAARAGWSTELLGHGDNTEQCSSGVCCWREREEWAMLKHGSRGFAGAWCMPAGVRSVSWGSSGKTSSQTSFCAGKLQVRAWGSVVAPRMKMGAY